MVTSIGIDEAQAKLKEIIAQLGPDDEVIITQDNQPLARLAPTRKPQFGSCRGMLLLAIEDEEHLADFQEYAP